MLRTFPNPYPDELLYSLFVRHHIRSGNKIFKQTIEDLLGYVPHQLYGLALPSNLNFLVEKLRLISSQTAEDLISNYTLYSFYIIFLTQSEAFLLKNLMRKKTSKPIFQVAKIDVAKGSEDSRLLKFCSQCLEKDLQKFGEAYWHRTHQIPGIFACLTHGTVLRESLVPIQEGYLNCHAADLKNCLVEVDGIVYKESTLQQLLAVAKDIIWLSSNDLNFKGLQWLRSRYEYYLAEKKFMKVPSSNTFKFDSQKFADAIFDFYGQEFWNVVKPGLGTHAERYFTHCLLACDIMPAIDRVTHIILIRFLSNSPKVFFKR